MELHKEKCEPCEKGTPPLSKEDAQELCKMTPDWKLKDKSIERQFKFKDFVEAMDFVNRVADLANTQNHHPDFHISYNVVTLELSTHKIGGLSRNDFILASQIDHVLVPA